MKCDKLSTEVVPVKDKKINDNEKYNITENSRSRI